MAAFTDQLAVPISSSLIREESKVLLMSSPLLSFASFLLLRMFAEVEREGDGDGEALEFRTRVRVNFQSSLSREIRQNDFLTSDFCGCLLESVF